MNLTDLQKDLRTKARELHAIEDGLEALHVEIEKMKPQDKPKLDIDFARITRVAARYPLVRERIPGAQPATKKLLFAALAYLIALDSDAIEDKLYYLCRLAQGSNYQVSAEYLCQLGLAYAPQDLDRLAQDIGDMKSVFMVEALVLANLAGPASRDVLGFLATLADNLDIESDEMRKLGRTAQAVLCFGVEFSKLQVGDIFSFGTYPQGANGEVQPIEWQVLRRDSEGLLVISKYALDCKPYNEEFCDITWSECTLRKWLNDEFVNSAFNGVERQQIKEVRLKNPNSHWNNVPGGSDTDDKVFLLSHDEAEQLFANDDARMCKPMEYAKKNHAYTYNGMCWWWLRSPGGNSYVAAIVYYDGGLSDYVVSSGSLAVRPAFKIAL